NSQKPLDAIGEKAERKLSENYQQSQEAKVTNAYYTATGELKLIPNQLQDPDSSKLDSRQSYAADSSDSISSYSSSSSFYPSSSGGKEKYTKYPPTSTPSIMPNRYGPEDDRKPLRHK
ncbi:hypothetical protein FHG87_006195, partial [Trinorchestia longiramus]